MWLRMLLDLVVAGTLGYLLLGRVSEPRTLWLLRGYLLLVALGWLLQRYVNLPLTAQLIEALVLVCGLALAILLQGELRRLLELLGTGHLATLLGSRTQDPQDSGTVDILVDTTAQLSKRRCGGLIVLDLGSDLRPEDFLNPGVAIDAMLSVDLMLNLFSADSPLHDGAVLIQANRVASAGVILPLSRQTSFMRHGKGSSDDLTTRSGSGFGIATGMSSGVNGMAACPNERNIRSNSASAMNRNAPSSSLYKVPRPGSLTDSEASNCDCNSDTKASTARNASR